MANSLFRHSGESRNPAFSRDLRKSWAPAFAGVTSFLVRLRQIAQQRREEARRLAAGAGAMVEGQRDRHAPVHLDIEADDVDAEAERLEKLGAKKIAFVKRWWVMEAPTGQRFCVVKMKYPERGAPAKEWA
jgi:hypothetical protein